MTRFDWGPKPNLETVTGYPGPKEKDFIVIAGPCSIEDREQVRSVCREISKRGVTFMRGGVYRAGTYPPNPQDFGLRLDLLYAWYGISKEYGLKIIVEVLDIRQLEKIASIANAIQIGARHMQDYALLKEVSQLDMPVTLKRHPGSNVNEFLGAAEYLCQGKCRPILVERGSSTFMDHVRWDLCVSLISEIKIKTKLPIIVDASHGSGRRELVEPLTLSGIAAGSDGFMVEVHPNPEQSFSDARQAYPLQNFCHLYGRARELWQLKRNWEEAC